jgi:hypothetical protein
MKIEKDEVLVFKLTSGEELIAKIVEVTDGMFILKQPVSMAPTQQGLQMMPSMFSGNLDKEIVLYGAAVSMIADAKEDIKAKYIEVTTGVVVPPEKKILVG